MTIAPIVAPIITPLLVPDAGAEEAALVGVVAVEEAIEYSQ